MASIERVAWVILALVSAALFGNYYVYDSIGPVAELLQAQRGFSDTQIGMLNAIYSLPNVVLVLVGGVLSDRFGPGRVTMWTAGICLAGAALTAWGPGYEWMAAGRLLFGIGAETFNISTTAAVVPYFAGRHLAFAIGMTLAIGRMGSYAADMSPEWFAGAYAAGWQGPMVIAAGFAGTSLVASVAYWWIDTKTGVTAPRTAEKFVARDLLRFGTAYWFLLILCVLFYAVILAFRSTFSIKYFQHAHGLTLAAAGAMNSYVFLAAIFATPAFGWLSDRVGRYAPLLAFGAFLLPVSIVIMAATDWSLWVATVLVGVSYSLVPAVMWPLASKLVAAERLGTALGLMFVVQNAGVAGANLVAGWLNDRAGASVANPAGYLPMMWFFGLTSAAGFVFALLLWRVAGRKEQEAITHGG
jgi:MFS family permease